MDAAEKMIFFFFLLQGVCCRDFDISLPNKIQALNGSCVIIKCRFEINETYDKDLSEKAKGGWITNGTDFNKQVFNSSTPAKNKLKGNITGKLKDKDCTTVFYDIRSNYSGRYFFRIEGEGGLKWTYGKTSVEIEVIESPPRPTVTLYEEQEEVLEGGSVSLRCSAETLCSSPPPTLTWSSTPRIPFSESRRLQLISDLNFTATRRHHNVTFTCTITYQLRDENKTAHNDITLHVQYAPKISPSSGYLYLFRVLIGPVVVALLGIMLSAVTCIYKQKWKYQQAMQEKGAQRSGGNAEKENDNDPVYVTMSSAEATRERKYSIIYSPVNFTNCNPGSQKVRRVSSLHRDNSVVRDCSEGLTKPESSMEESSGTREAQVIVTADVVTKQTESKESKEELFVDSSPVYAQVKRQSCRSVENPSQK